MVSDILPKFTNTMSFYIFQNFLWCLHDMIYMTKHTNKVCFVQYVMYRGHKTTRTCSSGALRINGIKTQFSPNVGFPHLCSTHTHYSDVIMSVMASQITSLTIVYSTICSDKHQRKHQRSASLVSVLGIHRWPVNSLHNWPVTGKCFHLMTSSCACYQHTAAVLRFRIRIVYIWMMPICHVAPW